jgi:hypothetical protein
MPNEILFAFVFGLVIFWVKAEIISRAIIAVVRAWKKPIVCKSNGNYDY